MEAESIQSLTPLLRQADQWREVLLLLPLLVALEAVLSADNAIALAAIARGLEVLVWSGGDAEPDDAAGAAGDGSGEHGSLHHAGLGSIVVTLALTDLAFSLDSVAAAVAVSDRLWLVMAGGVIGVIALRLTAELFIRWLEVYQHLETAGYLAVGLVGIRLLLRLGVPQVVPPEWLLLVLVAALFVWGFSVRSPQLEPPAKP